MTNRRPQRRGWMRVHAGGDAGQALVEVALTLPLLLLIMLGAVEFGRMAFAAIELSNAARAAAQYGSQNHDTALDTAGMLTAAQNDYTIDPTDISLTSTAETCNCSDTGAAVSCSSSTACSGAHIEVTLTIKTQANFDPLIHVPGFPGSITLHGWAIQTVLQ